MSARKFTYRFIVSCCCCLAFLRNNAQELQVKADRNSILIGERLRYELQCRLPSAGYAVDLAIPDSLPHFELLENNPFDTVKDEQGLLLKKQLVFTSFDSGSWQIPAFQVSVQRTGYARKFLTDSISVEVGYSPADSTGELRDIKPVIDVTVNDYTWYYVAAAVLLAAILAYILYRYYKSRKKIKGAGPDPAYSPYEEAVRALDALKGAGLNDAIQVKAFHSSLASIFKRYYGRRQSMDLRKDTTGDLLMHVKRAFADERITTGLAESLRCTDAVKFARYVPDPSASRQVLEQVKEAIGLIENYKQP